LSTFLIALLVFIACQFAGKWLQMMELSVAPYITFLNFGWDGCFGAHPDPHHRSYSGVRSGPSADCCVPLLYFPGAC